ncbi:MAG: sulfite exporter TauE/SafE family protein [Balneolaceae bacterium]
MIFIVLILCGLLAGILAGIFGVGGGILFTPVLFFLFSTLGASDPVSWTIGTSLFCTFTAAFSSTVQQKNQKNIYWRDGVKVGLFGAVGVYAGKQIVTSQYYTEDVFVTFFAIILVLVGVLFYRKGRSTVTLQKKAKKMGIVKSGIAGGIGGIIAALAGVGGGVVMVPFLNLGYRLPIIKAVSISSFAIVIISLSGWMQFAFLSETQTGITSYTIGYVDFGTGLPLIAGALGGGMLGAKFGHSIPRHMLQIGFSILLALVAGLMIYNLI